MKCPYCGATMVLRDAPYVYPTTKKAKDWGSVWVCENYPKCDTYVGCHKGTTIPPWQTCERQTAYPKERSAQVV